MGVFYSVTDLAKLDWLGDKNIHRFLMTWRMLTSQMQTTPPLSELTEIILQKVEKSVVLKEDVGHFYREDEEDPYRNSDFLIRSMKITWTARDTEPIVRTIFIPFCPSLKQGRACRLSLIRPGEIPLLK